MSFDPGIQRAYAFCSWPFPEITWRRRWVKEAPSQEPIKRFAPNRPRYAPFRTQLFAPIAVLPFLYDLLIIMHAISVWPPI
jgi:hypothetical protein